MALRIWDGGIGRDGTELDHYSAVEIVAAVKACCFVLLKQDHTPLIAEADDHDKALLVFANVDLARRWRANDRFIVCRGDEEQYLAWCAEARELGADWVLLIYDHQGADQWSAIPIQLID